MKIGGFLKQSFIDFPKTISAVIFTSGCNFNCWYCHNPQLINGNCTYKITIAEIYDFLKSRKNFLEGVVISGGEPTLQPNLKEVIINIKNLGYKIKLDTNGSNPEILQDLLNENLLDYVAMDIKNSLKNYNKTTKTKKSFEKEIKQSIKIIMESDVDYEFRTTFAPEITLNDINAMALLIKEAKLFYLQKYEIPSSLANISQEQIEQKQFVQTQSTNNISAFTLLNSQTPPDFTNPKSAKINLYSKYNQTALLPHSRTTYNTAIEIMKKYVINANIRGF
ncbi:MAG: anaerobic ribonucleoside-triphosphate reductase activating protein [Clostridia bacterium]|nr:anaerobic ribonucleoside-triphosphate reductase activating protein [Clostridia bacterium]